ncbi:hypothetical protein [Pontibacter mangrovi]|uniref:Uncharacterized protein n=1 Tax=Pontibacter mangrovi TaxID=2589816 RepID=A0A501W2Y2_9BACT|nr:hypothetical protein [Pontibacter mangrovi]TPE43969.1 hypothetical protein FJM65_11125 [Pontibacter mangrovi]
MLGSKLKKYKLVNAEGLGRIRTDFGLISLANITDAQAEKLFHAGSRYVEKVEKPASTTGTSRKKK